jgi:hypothetical protein
LIQDLVKNKIAISNGRQTRANIFIFSLFHNKLNFNRFCDNFTCFFGTFVILQIQDGV